LLPAPFADPRAHLEQLTRRASQLEARAIGLREAKRELA
jgi:hypothetical protein